MNLNLKCVVEDLPAMASEFESACPTQLRSRVSFIPYNFKSEPQPIKGADVYMIKRIFHDYTDKHSSLIIAKVLQAMKPSSRIVVIDGVQPRQGVLPWYMEKNLVGVDLQMGLALNAKNRQIKEWVALFKSIDERFSLKSVASLPGYVNSLMEFVLES